MRAGVTLRGSDLDRSVQGVAVGETEGLAQRAPQFLELLITELGRRAAAEMELPHWTVPVEQRPLQRDLADQPREITRHLVLIMRDDASASTIETGVAGVREMHIER